MGFRNKFIILMICLLSIKTPAFAAGKQMLEWRVENYSAKLEKAPSYANSNTPFPYNTKPVIIKKKKVFEAPKELTDSQRRALDAADVLNQVRSILNDKDIFNADTTNIKIDAVMQANGISSALIKNHWYETGEIMDVPIVAKENLVSLVDRLRDLDESLATVIEAQVNEKIEMVHNLSLRIDSINEEDVRLVDEQGNMHVINFRSSAY